MFHVKLYGGNMRSFCYSFLFKLVCIKLIIYYIESGGNNMETVEKNHQDVVSKLKLNTSTLLSFFIVLFALPVSTNATTIESLDSIDYTQADHTQVVEAEPVDEAIYENIDTDTTIYPQSDYTLIEAELPSDQVSINEDNLFTDEALLPFAQTDEVYNFVHFNAYKDTYRDIATYISYYIYYSADPEDHYLVAPMNLTADVVDLYNYSDLIAMQRLDINHKLRQIYYNEYSEDLVERYELKQMIPTSVYADAKASMLRAKELYSQVDPESADYDLATEVIEIAREEFSIFTNKYNNGHLEEPVLHYFISDQIEDEAVLEENIASIEEIVETLPSEIKRRLSNIYVLAEYEMPPSETPGFTLHGLAKDDGTVYFVGDKPIYKNLIYHEFGHTLDFASYALIDWDEESEDSWSTQDDWQAIYESEWADEDSYYNSTIESFAEGFGVYSLKYFLDEEPDLSAYPDSSLEDRPETVAYFDQLFETLDY